MSIAKRLIEEQIEQNAKEAEAEEAAFERVEKFFNERLNQPEREWVGLTDEEVGGLTVFSNGLHDVEVPILADLIRAVEAKLKEKNT